MAEDAAVKTASPEIPETLEEPEATAAADEATPPIAEIVAIPEPKPTLEEFSTDQTPDSYEAVPVTDMPGPAAAPETMEAASEAHPEPPDMAEVAKEDEAAAVSAATPPSGTFESEANRPIRPPPTWALKPRMTWRRSRQMPAPR